MARTPAAATPSSREAADVEMAARLVVEDHWAVAALSISDRQRARALAKRAWKRGEPRLRDTWPARDAELLSRVTDAYELAAFEQADALELAMRELDRVGVVPALPTPPADVTPPALVEEERRAVASITTPAVQAALLHLGSAITALRGASDIAFQFERTRPLPPPWDPAHLPHVLRALCVGALGGDVTALRQWIAAAQDARRETIGIAASEADDTPVRFLARWDAYLRDVLTQLWLELAVPVLTATEGADADAVPRAFEILGRLREQRAAREAEFLVSLPSDHVPPTRAQLQILYGLADATAHVVVWARRGVSALGVPNARLALASASALTAGDRTLDTAYHWLITALELPMIVAGLPTPGGTHAERATSAVEADRHAAPPRRGTRG